jgi:tRNA dimethylallyltransferase
MFFNKARTLPKLDFSKGIPKEYATMIVIPTIVKDTKKIDDMFEALEKYYLSNKSPNLYFTLLRDCKESDKKDLDIDFNNRRRLVRAYQKIVNNEDFDTTSKLLYETIFIGLTTDRDNLYNIIDNRVDDMFKDGLLNEVKPFFDKNIHSKVFKTAIGYKEVYLYLNKDITLDECKSLIKKNSRRYAKRQYTFFNHQIDNIKWFNTDYNNFNNTVNEVINYIEKAD